MIVVVVAVVLAVVLVSASVCNSVCVCVEFPISQLSTKRNETERERVSVSTCLCLNYSVLYCALLYSALPLNDWNKCATVVIVTS